MRPDGSASDEAPAGGTARVSRADALVAERSNAVLRMLFAIISMIFQRYQYTKEVDILGRTVQKKKGIGVARDRSEAEEFMKRLVGKGLLVFVAAASLVSLTGCVSNLFPGGPSLSGVLFTGVTDPAQNLAVAVDSGAGQQKRGTASAIAILGLIAVGDASLDAALKDGGITKVHHVDHQVNTVLFALFAQTRTIVYGE